MDDVDRSQQNSRIGNLLIGRGWLSQANLDRALKVQQKSGGRIGETLIELGFINKKQLSNILVKQTWSRSFLAGLMMATTPIMLTGCGGGGGDDTKAVAAVASTATNPTPQNVPPTVDAGVDVSVEQNVEVAFDATASDSDGSVETIEWVQVSGKTVTLNNPSSAQASFIPQALADPNVEETYTFRLTATDNDGALATDTINITVTPAAPTAPAINEPPVVEVVDDLTVEQNVEVTLDAMATDSDGTVANIEWSQVNGNSINITNASNGQATFISPYLVDAEVAETYEFEVIVTDDDGATTTDVVTVTVNPETQATGVASLSWSPPTENTDSSTLEDLAGFKIYYGESPENLEQSISIEDPNVLDYVFENLNSNTTYYFGVVAINSIGIESALSEVASKSF